jgi:DNA-binding transcriptional MerR regulator
MPERTLAELAALSGLPPRTIRYYIAQGLIPSPGKEGRGTRYPDSTLDRLRLIAKLRDAHQPLVEIRTKLASLTDDETAQLAAAPPEPAVVGSAIDYIRGILGTSAARLSEDESSLASLDTPAFLRRPPSRIPEYRPALSVGRAIPAGPAPTPAPAPSAQAGRGRSQWDRIPLGPNIELHVRRPMSRRDKYLVERLIALYGQLQREDQL